MSSNDKDKAINTAASVRRTRQGVTPPVGTATGAGAETPLNNPICPSTRAFKKLTIHGDATTAKVTITTCRKKAAPALKHPATVDGAKDKDTPTLMQLKCPPEVEMQQNATIEVTQTLLQLKDPPGSMVLLMLQLMWLSGRPMLLVAEVRGSIPAKHQGWSRR
jgi:hypothetical protein